MKINKPKVYRAGSFVRVSSKIDRVGGDFTMWCELPERYESVLNQNNQLSNAFLLALLPTALESGENIEIDEPVSGRLVYQLKNNVIPILLAARSDLSWIDISANILDLEVPNPTKSSTEIHSATGFSGGIDSFHTVAEHMRSKFVGYQLKSLIINNVIAQPDTFYSYAESMRDAASDIGLELVAINTNFSDCLSVPYYSYNMFYNISIAYLLNGYIDRYYLASGYDVDFAVNEMYTKKQSRGKDLAIYENMIVPMLSTERQVMVPFGSQYTRMQKVISVASFPPARKHLNVCMRPGIINCGRCGKCTRTMLALDILGSLDDFGDVFDLTEYYKDRRKHILVGLLHWSPYQKEIISWADSNQVYLVSPLMWSVCRIIQPLLAFFNKSSMLKFITRRFYRGELRKRSGG